MTILTAVLFLKSRLLKIAKPPVLRTCGNDNSKSKSLEKIFNSFEVTQSSHPPMIKSQFIKF